MGTGSSCTKVEQFDKRIQVPSLPTSSSRSSSESLSSVPPPPPLKPNQPSSSRRDEKFRVETNTDEYITIWDNKTKLSSSLQQSLKNDVNKVDHHQKETMTTKWSGKSSINLESAHIQSTLNTETHSCINLSTSEKIDELIGKLQRIHKQLDETIKHRTEQISLDTQFLLTHVINENHGEQQRLLQYAKQQQTKQDEYYRDLLQKYIVELDENKAKDLLKLQKELQMYREEIIRISQFKITTINDQANIIKSKIVGEEQQQTSRNIEAVILQLQNLSTDESFQQLGSELISKTSLISNTNVGTKAIGQNCTFDFVQDVSMENSTNDEQSRQIYTKTTYSDIKSERRLNSEEVITQIGKKVPINPRSQLQESR